MRRCVWFRNLKNEEAMAHWGLSRQIKKYRNWPQYLFWDSKKHNNNNNNNNNNNINNNNEYNLQQQYQLQND